ncbi:MAG: NAD(P)-dependent oxidoreductase [Propionibacteriaceae bacterium]
MDITVVGASRGTGAEVVRQAVAAGHRVRAVSRSGAPGGDAITPFALDATDTEALRPAVAGADAVIVTVGGGQTSRADVTRAVIAAMTAEGVRRVVAQSSYGVGESYDSMPFVVKRLVVPLFLKRALADHAVQEAVIAASGLDWTVTRPGGLTSGDGSGSVRLAPGDGSSGSLGRIDRADAARVLLDAVADPSTFGHAFTIVRG